MIKYIYNDGSKVASGYATQARDCSVRAFAIMQDIDYEIAYRIMQAYGRKSNKAFAVSEVYDVLMTRIPRGIITSVDTLENFAKQNPTGRFLITTFGHATIVIDGEVHDVVMTAPTERVTGVWVKKEDSK
jgi:hypothetical protein